MAARKLAVAGVGADVIGTKDVVAEAASVQPVAYRDTARRPQQVGAPSGVVDDNSRQVGCHDGRRLSCSTGTRVAELIEVKAVAGGEPGDRFASGEMPRGADEVDGVAAVRVVA